MKQFAIVFVYVAASAAFGQAPAAVSRSQGIEPEADAVIATFDDGKKLTYGEMKLFIETLPPQLQQAALRDRKNFISQYALTRKLTQMAEENKLDQQSPNKEVIQAYRMQVLMRAQLNQVMSGITVPPEDIKGFYQSNRDRFSQTQVKALYIAFVSGNAAAGGKKYLTEAEARIKIEGVLKQIRGGADFVKMVHQYSEDQTSAAKDGEFGNLRRTDNLPDAVRDAIFSLKEGEVSEPVRQPNGFYLFRAGKTTVRPFEEVRDEIFNELQQNRFREWMDGVQRSLKLKIEDEPFSAPAQPASGASSSPAR